MGRSIPVRLGRFTFKSKSAAKDALRRIRDAHEDREPIVDEDEIDLLLGVVAVHPQAAQKVGAGIAGFFAARAPEYGTRCFYLRRVDGTETDFSWNEAMSPTPPLTRLRMACRNAIAAQKLAFKDRAWPLGDPMPRTCPITGVEFTRDQAHVDHQPPSTLMALVDEWLRAESLSVEDVRIDQTGDLRAVDTFADSAQAARWEEFHRLHATLRLVSASGNMQQGARFRELATNDF